MILTVEHVTRYHYDRPLRMAVQSLRMWPSRFDGQRVMTWQLEVEGGDPGPVLTDGAGDQVQSWSVRGPTDTLVISATGQVETHDLTGVLQGHREVVPPRVYLRATPATQVTGGLAELAEIGEHPDSLSLAHALCRAVSEAITYRPGSTQTDTTAAEALALGEGVCQDHAHALIACARVHKLPARYVSGYLQASADGSAHEAAHAWAEIHLNELGWVGFDPANGCCPDERYIRLGSGFDAVHAAPIRGRVTGASNERMQVCVAITANQQ